MPTSSRCPSGKENDYPPAKKHRSFWMQSERKRVCPRLPPKTARVATRIKSTNGKKQAVEDFAQLFEEDRKGERAREAEHEKQVNELCAEIGRLSAQLSWLKKNLAGNLSRAERLEMLEKNHSEIPLRIQADLLGIGYSSLFYEPTPPSARELAIKRRIDDIYTACPFYGSRKIAFLLRPEFGISRPTIQAYMREMGIFALVPGTYTSQPAPQHLIYPYLLRNVTAVRSNQIWGIDITYIRLTTRAE